MSSEIRLDEGLRPALLCRRVRDSRPAGARGPQEASRALSASPSGSLEPVVSLLCLRNLNPGLCVGFAPLVAARTINWENVKPEPACLHVSLACGFAVDSAAASHLWLQWDVLHGGPALRSRAERHPQSRHLGVAALTAVFPWRIRRRRWRGAGQGDGSCAQAGAGP